MGISYSLDSLWIILLLCALFILLFQYAIFTRIRPSKRISILTKRPREYEICSNICRNLSSPLTQHKSFTWLAQHITTVGGNRRLTHTKTLIQNIQLEKAIKNSSTITNSSNFDQWEPLWMQNCFFLDQILNELGLRSFSHWKHLMLQHRFCISPTSSCKFGFLFFFPRYIFTSTS